MNLRGYLMKIRFCENNEGSGPVCKRLRAEYPELDIKRKKCVKNCGICNSALFALVEGDPVRGGNGYELYLRIVELL
jgi:uncharacterized protein YuzB (UPF0349 family)